MSDVRANAGVPVLAQFGGTSTPSACAPLVVDSATGYIYSWKTGDTIVAAGAAGTVTSVAETFTGGLISVAGSPITTTGTLALTVAGTSGGIPYFSGATTWASSGVLAAKSVVLGGGAGAAPTTITAGTNNQVLRGNTGADPSFGTVTLASADFVNQGTTTTLLHGNAAGNPSWGAASLTADVSGILPTANGGTGIAYFTAAGPSVARVYTFPDAAATILYSGGALGTPASGTLTNCTSLPAAGVTGTALVAAAIGTTVQAYDADLTTWAGVSYETGTTSTTFTFNGSGGTSGAVTLTWQRIGNWVTINVPAVTATAGTSSDAFNANTAVAASARPATAQYGVWGGGINNGAGDNTALSVSMQTSGLLKINRGAFPGTAWTNSATAGTNFAMNFTYYIG